MKKLISFLLCGLLLMALIPGASAARMESDLCPDLSAYLQDPARRGFVRQMVGYYLRHDSVVQENLKNGYCAVFFFEGCSDNMNHPEYRDVSYYRVSAACLVLKLDEQGNPQITYYNDNCSTLPDRPTDYGPRKEEVPADIGPATIQDGTYELCSVRHGRTEYEALNLRDIGEDAAIPAIYMTAHGYTKVRATQINIHTRTNNHILKHQMWSEGCVLVGSGEEKEFAEFMEETYYGIYDFFVPELRVGCVTINRQFLKEELYELYGDQDAVDYLLSASRSCLPQKYLERCGEVKEVSFSDTLWAVRDTPVMTLPCGNATDARSVPMTTIREGEALTIRKSITNTRGATWFLLDVDGQTGYVYSGDFKEPTQLERFWRKVFG